MKIDGVLFLNIFLDIESNYYELILIDYSRVAAEVL